jgi:hypothetical protein
VLTAFPPVFLQDGHSFKGYATEAGTGLYAKALAATVGANHFNRVTWVPQDPKAPEKSERRGQQHMRVDAAIFR